MDDYRVYYLCGDEDDWIYKAPCVGTFDSLSDAFASLAIVFRVVNVEEYPIRYRIYKNCSLYLKGSFR